MKISKNCVVAIAYELQDSTGEVLDSQTADSPLEYLHGHGEIVPGLEQALADKQAGDDLKVVVKPEDGYGKRHEGRVLSVPREQLGLEETPELGMCLSAERQDGSIVPVWVTGVQGDKVTLDGNHPLAGKDLHFTVQVVAVRAASEEELAHGHVHGEGHDH